MIRKLRQVSAKRLSAALLAFALVVTALSACSKKDDGTVPTENQFTAWISTADDYGTYYSKYEENPAIQWFNNQYWDTSNHTLGTDGNGEKIALSFVVPVSGSQRENFTTMIATGTYPEVLDLNYADSVNTLVEDGVLIEITEYVEQYLPNYLAFFERHPELKKFACETDENGKDHWYKIGAVSDFAPVPWGGFTYRRDWVVKYAVPTVYVWDWESDYIKSNGHPKVTPLSVATEQGDFTGWKQNPVTAFESGDGDGPPNDTYWDNVIFPSGKADPYTISDWEWMFEAFAKAIKERGFEDNANAYCATVTYPGFSATGELVSSFGGGTGLWYLNPSGQVEYTGANENFKTYVECLNSWYSKGWFDTKFETRSSDMFFAINMTGFSQGMVGLAYTNTYLGDIIRATCADESDKLDAMVFGCALPINDVYGSDAQKFFEPDCFYQDPVVDNSPMGFTNKCIGKNMEALFSLINWKYSPEGELFSLGGLSEEQYQSMTFEPDLYERLGITSGYTVSAAPDGTKTMTLSYPYGTNEVNAIRGLRLFNTYVPNSVRLPEYLIDWGLLNVVQRANEEWIRYSLTGGTMQYRQFMDDEEAQLYNKTNTYINDYMAQAVPQMIKGGLAGWDDYVKRIGKFAPEKISMIFQQYVDAR